MDSMAPSPVPCGEGTLVDEVEEAEDGSGKLGSFLRLRQGASTDPHRTSSSTARPTHTLALRACCPGLWEPSLLEPGRGTGSCTLRLDLVSAVCSYGHVGLGADVHQEPPQVSHVLV